jgi:cysteine synthase B
LKSETAARVRAQKVFELVGNTPLLALNPIVPDLPSAVSLCAKAEYANPGGSIKDRPALNMILEGERHGKLKPGMRILEATSGNTGIALAMVGTAKGYPVTLCLPRNANRERKDTLRAFGAVLILTDPGEGTDGAIKKARELYAEKPDKYFYPDQYSNPANWQAHYKTTALEINEQTGGEITHLVAGLGTSGTFVGTGRRLRELIPNIRLISVQPDSPWHGLEGMKHMESAMVPAIYDPTLADENMEVGTEDAQEMTRRLGRAGLLVGISSGANVVAALRVARKLESGVVVTILCDGGERYMSEAFWHEDQGTQG